MLHTCATRVTSKFLLSQCLLNLYFLTRHLMMQLISSSFMLPVFPTTGIITLYFMAFAYLFTCLTPH